MFSIVNIYSLSVDPGNMFPLMLLPEVSSIFGGSFPISDNIVMLVCMNTFWFDEGGGSNVFNTSIKQKTLSYIWCTVYSPLLTHWPTEELHPTMQLSNQECDRTRAPFSTVQRFILTPSSTTTPAPMVTLGPMVQFSPIWAVGSCREKKERTHQYRVQFFYLTCSSHELHSPPKHCQGNRALCAASRERVVLATEGTCTSLSGSLWADQCPSRNLQTNRDTTEMGQQLVARKQGCNTFVMFNRWFKEVTWSAFSKNH